MNYQPWQYAETKILHDLFQQKFGKVWNCKVQHDSVKHVYLTVNQTLDITFSQLSLDEPSEDILPALTLSSFCEFVDEVFGDTHLPVRSFLSVERIEHLIGLSSPKYILRIDVDIAGLLKHFAVDNWDEPEKIIEEVKKYL
jgi:hypothetical protein